MRPPVKKIILRSWCVNANWAVEGVARACVCLSVTVTLPQPGVLHLDVSRRDEDKYWGSLVAA